MLPSIEDMNAIVPPGLSKPKNASAAAIGK